MPVLPHLLLLRDAVHIFNAYALQQTWLYVFDPLALKHILRDLHTYEELPWYIEYVASVPPPMSRPNLLNGSQKQSHHVGPGSSVCQWYVDSFTGWLA